MFVQDASKLLIIARNIKNVFAPINRIPPEVLSLIPDYCSRSEFVALTHVCRSWRRSLISRASLWTFLNCMDLDQTRTYLERSKTSPLEIRVEEEHVEEEHVPHGAFLLAIAHTHRLKALTLVGRLRSILELAEHLVSLISPAPLLEKLEIHVWGSRHAAIESTLFDGDLQSLRELRLHGVITDLPWKNLSNLTIFYIRQIPDNGISVTRLLDFFEHAPLLRKIKLMDSLPDFSDAPTQRVVSLPHLRLLKMSSKSALSILLNHLRIPTGTSVTLEFLFYYEPSPLLDYLPLSLDTLGNISHITSVRVNFGPAVTLLLEGPSGDLFIIDSCVDFSASIDRFLRCLNRLPISSAETLEIALGDTSGLSDLNEYTTSKTLIVMNNVRTLTFNDCPNPAFICVLNPNRNTSNTVMCPKLEELILYTHTRPEESYVTELLEMARERALRGAKLSTFVINCPQELDPTDTVFGLRGHVSRVEHQLAAEIYYPNPAAVRGTPIE